MRKHHHKENDSDNGNNSNHNADDDDHAPSNLCDNNQGMGKLMKKIGTHNGWKYQWTTPPQNLLRSIIPGPFVQPKLVQALPYVVSSNCKDCIRKNVLPERKLRSGIPDPWLEYLAWKENSSLKDARSSWEYMWLTDFVWNNRRLAMVQGIPDPWRVDFDCTCFEVHAEATRKKSKKRINRDKNRDEVSGALPTRDLKGKGEDIEKPKKEQKKVRNDYDKVKDNMTELEDELKLKEVEKKETLKKATRSAVKTEKRKSGSPEKVIDADEKPIKKISPRISKDKARVNFDARNDRLNDDIMKIKQEAKLRHEKIQKLKDKEEGDDKRFPRKKNEETTCPGKCGRICRNELLVKSIKYNDDNASTITSPSVASAKESLRKINNRIKITKNALNAPVISKRERGAGDDVIDLQSSLFMRSAIAIDCQALDCRLDRQRYQQTLLRRNHASAAPRESEVLIVEAFSEQD